MKWLDDGSSRYYVALFEGFISLLAPNTRPYVVGYDTPRESLPGLKKL